MGKNYFLKLQIAKIFPVVFLFCMPGLHCRKPAENPEFRLQQIRQTPLESTPESVFSTINDIEIDANNNFIIVDSYQTRHAFIFNQNGAFIQKLGSHGQGPGEYTEPTSIGIRPDGEIWLSDYLGRCVNIYNPDYQYIRKISIKGGIIRYLLTPATNYFIMYESAFTPFSNRLHETITRYDLNGVPLNRFAKLQQEVADLQFIAGGQKNIAMDSGNYIYEINPLFYQIRKFDPEGNAIKTVTPGSNPFRADAIVETMINGPFIVNSKYLVVQIGKHLDIFDLELNQLAKELPFEEKMIYAKDGVIYTFVWPHEARESSNEAPVINQYTLSRLR